MRVRIFIFGRGGITRNPALSRVFGFLVAGVGLPSPLRGSVMSAGSAGLGVNLLRRFKTSSFPNEKGPHKGTLCHLVAGARFGNSLRQTVRLLTMPRN